MRDASLTLTTSGRSLGGCGARVFNDYATRSYQRVAAVFSQGVNITANYGRGKLAGQLASARPGNSIAASVAGHAGEGLAAAVNTQHQAGFDLNGAAGGNFFAPSPVGGVGAASSLTLAITDPNKIAASASGAVGDNANANAILALQTAVISGRRR